jgi:hypothetical protein
VDPYPAFQVNPDPDPGFEDKKYKKKLAGFFFFSFFDQKLQFNYS